MNAPEVEDKAGFVSSKLKAIFNAFSFRLQAPGKLQRKS